MISNILRNIFGAILPLMYAAGVTAVAGFAPPLGAFIAAILQIPPVKWLMQKAISWGVGWMIDNGVIELKDSLLVLLDDKAKAAYAPQIALLREAQAKDSLTPEEEADYAKKLQDIVKNRPGVVNA